MGREQRSRLVVFRILARRRARRRLLVAEQRFFDAYCRGGHLARRELVVPLDYFVRPPVEQTLLAWLVDGEPLNVETLAEAWTEDEKRRELSTFYANLAQYLAILHKGSGYAITTRGP